MAARPRASCSWARLRRARARWRSRSPRAWAARSSASIRRRSIAAWTSAPPNPTPRRGRAIPHHLIDIIDPTETLFRGALRARGAAPRSRTSAGAAACPSSPAGTMLYFRALSEGLSDAARRGSAGARRNRRARRARGLAGAARASWRGSTRALRHGCSRPTRSAYSVRWRSGTLPACRCRRCRGGARTAPPRLARRCASRWCLPIASGCTSAIARRFDAMLAAGLVDEVCALRRALRSDRRPALDALRRLPPGVGIPRRSKSTRRHCARAASPRPGSSPNASSRGCARPKPWRSTPTQGFDRPRLRGRLLAPRGADSRFPPAPGLSAGARRRPAAVWPLLRCSENNARFCGTPTVHSRCRPCSQ